MGNRDHPSVSLLRIPSLGLLRIPSLGASGLSLHRPIG